MGKKKLTYEFVEKQFNGDNYELLSDSYVNCSSKLQYRCPKGHEHSISWDNWKQGHRCPYCAGQGKPTIKFIRKSFEKDRYELLTELYINSDQQLSYVCPYGHTHTMKWNNWRNGRRCPSCKAMNLSKMMSGSGHPNWKGGVTSFNKELRNFVKSIGWINDVFKRDNYVCKGCKKRGGKLAAHHVIPLSYIREYFNITDLDIARKCDILFDVANGETMCEGCHKIYHEKLKKRGELSIMEDRIFGEVKWFSASPS